MSEIKRYDITSADGYTSIVVEESKIGNYVKYDDIKHLLKTSHNSDYEATCDKSHFAQTVYKCHGCKIDNPDMESCFTCYNDKICNGFS